ncbi:MAG: hypothetical protein WCJ30_02160 [Deltaproteobacteria bacterium]
MAHRILALAAWFLSAFFVAPVLRADVVTVEVAACNRHNVGDACIVGGGQRGICAAASCSRINYTSEGPRGSVSYPCLECRPAPPGSTPAAGPTPAPATTPARCSAQPGTSHGPLLASVLAAAIALALGRRRRVPPSI